MPTSCNQHVCNGTSSSDTFFDDLSNTITQSSAFSDSPDFRKSLAETELLAAQIQAHYLVIAQSCRQAIESGQAFASALTNLAQSIDVRKLPKQTYSLLNIPKLRAGFDCDPLEGLSQVQQVLCLVSSHTASMANRLKEPLHFVLEAQEKMNQLLDLRASFHRASDQLDSALIRLSGKSPSRSQSDLNTSDINANEVHQIYRNTATAYMTELHAAISATPILAFLRSNSSLLLAEQELIDHLTSLKQGGDTLPDSPEMLQEFLTKLINWTDTNYRMMKVRDGRSSVELSLDVQKPSSDHHIPMEGYLFNRKTKRTWHSWARRWFRLSNNQLIYCKRLPCLNSSELQLVIDETVSGLNERLSQDSLTKGKVTQADHDCFHSGVSSGLINRLAIQCSPSWKVLEPDLRLCTAREGSSISDRRFTFELISHGNRIHVLQADSFAQRERWIEALRSGLIHLQHANSNLSSIEPCVSSSPILFKTLASMGSPKLQSDNSDSPVPGSQPSSTDFDQLRHQGGIMLWQEPYGTGNRSCADCLSDGASWASINLGVTLCTHCAAAHRSLGVHISKIRSLTLDNWEPELLHLMLNLGNRLVNSVYEADLPTKYADYPRPKVSSSPNTRLQWVRAKWVDCRFVRLPLLRPISSGSDDHLVYWLQKLFERWSDLRNLLRQSIPQRPQDSFYHGVKDKKMWADREKRRVAIFSDLRNTLDRLQSRLTDSKSLSSPRRSTLLRVQEQELAAAHVLLTGAQLGCPPLMLLGLAAGAHPDGLTDRCTVEGHSDHPPPLIVAVKSGSLAACEFLLLNGANIDVQDHLGQTPLHHACRLHRVHLVCLFLRRHADQSKADSDGRVPLDIAIQTADADIVTLLRLQRLHDDDNENDFTSTDDMVSDVFRDYTSRAYDFFDSDEACVVDVPELVSISDSPLPNSPCAMSSPTSTRLQRLSPTTKMADCRRRRLLSPVRKESPQAQTLSISRNQFEK